MLFEKFKVGDVITNFTEIELSYGCEEFFPQGTKFVVKKILKQENPEGGQLLRLEHRGSKFTVCSIWFEKTTKLDKLLF